MDDDELEKLMILMFPMPNLHLWVLGDDDRRKIV